MKNLKLGVKISIGFGLLIAIACALGGMAVLNMRGVEGQSTRLVQEYIPELAIANSVERAALQTMLEMRSYGYTEDKKQFDAGMRNFADLKRSLAEAKAAVHPHPALTRSMIRVALPLFTKEKVCFRLFPAILVPKSCSTSVNVITG